MEKYLICSYRSPPNAGTASRSMFNKLCAKVARSARVLSHGNAKSQYLWRCTPDPFKHSLVHVHGSHNEISYDARNGNLLSNTMLPVRMLVFKAMYLKYEIRMYSKETVIINDSKEVWKSSYFVIRGGIANSSDHIIHFVGDHLILYRLDFKKFEKCMEAGQLNKPEAFIKKIDSNVANISQTTDIPVRVYYIKLTPSKSANYHICVNGNELACLGDGHSKALQISYCADHVCMSGVIKNTDSKATENMTQLFKVSVTSKSCILKAAYKHAYQVVQDTLLTTFKRYGVIFAAVYLKHDCKIDIVAYHFRSSAMLVKSIDLIAEITSLSKKYLSMNYMMNTDLNTRYTALVMVFKTSVSQVKLKFK